MWVVMWVVICCNHVIGLMTMTLQLSSFLDTSFAERGSRLSRKGLNGNLVKNLQPNKKDWEGKPEDNENILAP